MIDAIELTDWESHEHTLIELCDTVTVILGQSHNGKSGIIRAINWVQNNDPVSTVYFPRGKKKPNTTVSISKDDSFVSRVRNKTKNYYEMEDGEFTALRSGVPDEVKSFLGMTEINTQLQKDVHFMLTDTAGQRAKRLNDIAGLAEMDIAMSAVNSRHTKVKSIFDAKTLLLGELEEKHSNLKWVLDAEKEFDVLQEIDAENAKRYEEIEQLTSFLSTLQSIDEQLQKLPDPKIKDEIEEIFKIDDHLYNLELEEEEIEKRIKTYTDCKNALNDIRLPDDSELLNLNAKSAEFGRLKQDITDIKSAIQIAAAIEQECVVKDKEILAVQQEETDFLASFSVCPFCAKPM